MARDESFERVAAEYDAVRPGYPGTVYDRIIEFGSLSPETKVLEVGSGTGRATAPLAERGFEIQCIEPGSELSAIARANLAPFPRVLAGVADVVHAHGGTLTLSYTTGLFLARRSK